MGACELLGVLVETRRALARWQEYKDARPRNGLCCPAAHGIGSWRGAATPPPFHHRCHRCLVSTSRHVTEAGTSGHRDIVRRWERGQNVRADFVEAIGRIGELALRSCYLAEPSVRTRSRLGGGEPPSGGGGRAVCAGCQDFAPAASPTTRRVVALPGKQERITTTMVF